MSIPLATTTVTIKGVRPQSAVDPDADGYDTPAAAPATLATEVRASITLPSGTRGSRNADEIDSYIMRMDNIPDGLNQHDTVLDESTGIEYEVVSALPSLPEGYGLEHTKAKLQVVRGLNSGGESDEFARD